MACSYANDSRFTDSNYFLSAIRYTEQSGSMDYRVFSLPDVLPNNATIEGFKIRITSTCTALNASTRSYRFIVYSNVSGTRTVTFVSSIFTTSGTAGTSNLSLSPIYTVPATGNHYAAIQVGVINSRISGSYDETPYYFSTSDSLLAPMTLLWSQAALAAYVTVGTTLTNIGITSDRWVNIAPLVCTVDAVALTADGISSGSSVATTVATAEVQTVTDSMSAGATLDTATITAAFTLDAGSLSAGSAVTSATPGVQGQASPDAVDAGTTITTPTISLQIPLTASDLSAGTALDSSASSLVLNLSATSLSCASEVDSSMNTSLGAFALATGSSRTPDAGITMDFEASGIPISYSWYNKTLWRFRLEFDQLTEEQCLWLEDFCGLNKYREIDYAWPFDSHTYRCVFASDVSESIIRSDTVLGVRCKASFELVGYEVA